MQWTFEHLFTYILGPIPAALKPEHRLFSAHETFRQDLLEKINTGFITPHKAGIEKVTKTGILLTDGSKLEVDAIIAATGYLVRMPTCD